MPKTNKLFEYSLKAAKVGKILLVPSRLSIPTAASDTRSKLMSMGAFYAPTKARPETLYFTYCAAIIDAILELYRASNNLYSQIKVQWGTPDCKAIIRQFEAELTKHHKIRPTFLVNMMSSQPDGEGWKSQESLVCDFIKRYCNRPSDPKKGKVNIQAKTSKYLTLVLVFRSLCDYLRLNFDDMNVYRGEAKGIMEQRKHSRLRDKFVKALKQAGCDLHYGDNIRDAAHLWVRVRIFRAHNITIDEFASDRGISKRKLLDRLDPFDKAMDYDKHPG